VVEPDPRRAAHYAERFAAYKEIYPRMRELYDPGAGERQLASGGR